MQCVDDDKAFVSNFNQIHLMNYNIMPDFSSKSSITNIIKRKTAIIVYIKSWHILLEKYILFINISRMHRNFLLHRVYICFLKMEKYHMLITC